MINKYFILFVLLAIVSIANAQTISRKVVSNGGGILTAGGSQITFTIGETLITSLSASGAMITQGFQQPGEQIKTGTVSSTICGGNNFSLSFTANDIGGGNVFTAQLSNAAGSFASPVAIGTLYGNASAGIINVTIPTNTIRGTGYRIRVTSSSPANIGVNNGTNITINTASTASITYSGGPFCNSGNVNVSRSGQSGGTYNASPSGLNINSSNGKINLASSLVGDYTVTYSFSNGTCSNIATTTVNIGSCKGNNRESIVLGVNSKSINAAEVVVVDKFEVLVYPNPSAYQFNLVVDSSSKEQLDVIVYDISGKMVKHFVRNKEESIVFGEELPRGVYIALISQGANSKTVKLIKQ
jgi:hypothetical protein